jgi:hypothetical protein
MHSRKEGNPGQEREYMPGEGIRTRRRDESRPGMNQGHEEEIQVMRGGNRDKEGDKGIQVRRGRK